MDELKKNLFYKSENAGEILKDAEIIFMGIPSTAVVGYLANNKPYINPEAVIVNLAKGFGKDDRLIPECLSDFMPNPILTMKGPSFAREIINRQETGFTLGKVKMSLSRTKKRLREKLRKEGFEL